MESFGLGPCKAIGHDGNSLDDPTSITFDVFTFRARHARLACTFMGFEK